MGSGLLIVLNTEGPPIRHEAPRKLRGSSFCLLKPTKLLSADALKKRGTRTTLLSLRNTTNRTMFTTLEQRLLESVPVKLLQ